MWGCDKNPLPRCWCQMVPSATKPSSLQPTPACEVPPAAGRCPHRTLSDTIIPQCLLAAARSGGLGGRRWALHGAPMLSLPEAPVAPSSCPLRLSLPTQSPFFPNPVNTLYGEFLDTGWTERVLQPDPVIFLDLGSRCCRDTVPFASGFAKPSPAPGLCPACPPSVELLSPGNRQDRPSHRGGLGFNVTPSVTPVSLSTCFCS